MAKLSLDRHQQLLAASADLYRAALFLARSKEEETQAKIFAQKALGWLSSQSTQGTKEILSTIRSILKNWPKNVSSDSSRLKTAELLLDQCKKIK